MDARTVISHFGGVNRTARAFGVKPPSVALWLKRGCLPQGREYQAQALTNGKFKVASIAGAVQEACQHPTRGGASEGVTGALQGTSGRTVDWDAE